MIHGHDSVDTALSCTHEDRIGGKRAVDGDALVSCPIRCGADHIDFLAADIAAIAGMRIKTAKSEPRAFDAGLAQHAIEEPNRPQDLGLVNALRDIADRHMACYPARPEPFERIDLADIARKVEIALHPLHLVLSTESGGMQ